MCQIKSTIRGLWHFLPSLLLLGTILATLAGSGCVFSAREPEEPLDVDVNWLPPFQPENVLANMEAGIEARYITNYRDSLDESFFFEASPSAQTAANSAGSQDYFLDFGFGRELAAMQKLFTQADALGVTWNSEILEESGERVIFALDEYELTVSYGDGSESVFSGYAEITLERQDNIWLVTEWDERDNESDLSWGHLRLNLDVETDRVGP